jgi:hypothetical protein
MHVSTYRDEKKVDQGSDHDNVLDDAYRIERLERLVEILCTDLLHMKEQQMKSHKQVLELQSDLAAAEAARQAVEEQIVLQQLRDHELLTSLKAKQEQQQAVQHICLYPENDTTSRQQFDVIDVTTYCDGSDVNDYSDEQVIALEGVDQVNSPQQYVIQLWEELSETVQRLSSDMIERRDMLEFRWTKLQLEQNIRLHHIEEECVKQCEALKDMSIEWDSKLNELNEQIQQAHQEMTSEKVSNGEIKDKVQQITTQYTQIEQMVQRYRDYNRQINGERIVMKRENEIQIQKLNNEIQNITNTIQQQSEHITNLQAVGQSDDKEDVTPMIKTPEPVAVVEQEKFTSLFTSNHDQHNDEAKYILHTRSTSLSLPDLSSYGNKNPMEQLMKQRSHSI